MKLLLVPLAAAILTITLLVNAALAAAPADDAVFLPPAAAVR